MDWMMLIRRDRHRSLGADHTGPGRRPADVDGYSIRYGDRWPQTFPEDRMVTGYTFVLQHLSFLASKWVDQNYATSSRIIRPRCIRRCRGWPAHQARARHAERLRGRVTGTRAAAAVEHDVSDAPREIDRKHCWWVVGHNMVRYRGTAKEQVVYQPAHIRDR